MKIEVLTSSWNGLPSGGLVEFAKPSADTIRLVAGAEAAGVVKVVSVSAEDRAKLKKTVESQAASEKAYERAQESGAWHEGQKIQADLDAENPDAPKVSV